MVKRNRSAPVQSSVRTKRNTQPTMASVSGDSALIKYSANGEALNTNSEGTAARGRWYIGGYDIGLVNPVGTNVVKQYSTCCFKPGTRIRYEPSCSFNTSGRVVCAFTDNPEVMATWASLIDNATKIDFIQAFGSVRSFPIWQETDIPFPTITRRKRFTVDGNPDVGSVANNDRSAQMLFMYAIEGGPVQVNSVGRFWFHDVVNVEGLVPSNTT